MCEKIVGVSWFVEITRYGPGLSATGTDGLGKGLGLFLTGVIMDHDADATFGKIDCAGASNTAGRSGNKGG